MHEASHAQPGKRKHRFAGHSGLRGRVGAIIAATAACAIATASIVVGVDRATAAPGDSSAAAARFLSGSLLAGGVDLDSIASVGGVQASTANGPAPQTQAQTLDLTALNLLNVAVPGGISLPFSQFLQVGAANQFAQAEDNGVSRAASGAVDNAGTVDTTGTGAFPANASIDIAGLLGPAAAGVLDTGAVTLRALTAVAAAGPAQTPTVACGDLSNPVDCRGYNIAGVTISLHSPLIAALVASINTALGTASATTNALTSTVTNGVLGGVTSSLAALDALTPGLSLVSNTLAVTITADLQAALAPVLAQTLTDGVVSINLATGAITADLAGLTGGLNNLAPSTPILNAAVVNNLVTRVGALLTGLQTTLATDVTSALNAVTVSISGGICLLQVVVTCTAGLNVGYTGTLGALAAGTAPLTVAGTGLLAVLTGPLLNTVTTTLQATLGTVTAAALPTASAPVSTAVTSALSTLTTALDPVLNLISGVLGLTANVQTAGSGTGTYREVAVRASVGAGLAATVDLARAEVGANSLATPSPAPTIIGNIQPANQGPLPGGNTVTLNGTGFIAGTTVVFAGTTITPTTIAGDGSSLTFVVPAGTTAGQAESVNVHNSNGDSGSVTYTYDEPALAVSSPVAPGAAAPMTSPGWSPHDVVSVQLETSAHVAVGTPVSITADAGGAFPTGSTLPIPLTAPDGNYLAVATDGAGNTATAALVVHTGAITPPAPPVALSLDPTSGPVTGGQLVTISGAGFAPGSIVHVDGTGVAPETIAVDGSSLTFLTPPHAIGPVGVSVTSGTQSTATLTYTYLPIATLAPPVITTPADGSTTTDTSPPIAGTGAPGATVIVAGPGTVCSATVAADASWTCTPTSPMALGLHTVTSTQSTVTLTSASSPAVRFTIVTAPLASTGTNLAYPSAAGLLALILGGGLLLLGRRRRLITGSR